MSIDFDIVCRDCRAHMGLCDANGLDKELQKVCDNQHAWQTFAMLAESKLSDCDIEVRLRGHYLSFDFIRRHAGHAWAVKCEYEHFDYLEARLAVELSYDEYDRLANAQRVRDKERTGKWSSSRRYPVIRPVKAACSIKLTHHVSEATRIVGFAAVHGDAPCPQDVLICSVALNGDEPVMLFRPPVHVDAANHVLAESRGLFVTEGDYFTVIAQCLVGSPTDLLIMLERELPPLMETA